MIEHFSKLSYNAKSSQIGNSIDRKHVGLLCHKQAKEAGQNFNQSIATLNEKSISWMLSTCVCNIGYFAKFRSFNCH